MTPKLPTYFGGKSASGVPHTLINQIPHHETFVSGFLGHCAVTRHKLPAGRTIGYDTDPLVVRRWRSLRAKGFPIEVRMANFLEQIIYVPTGNPKTFLFLDPPYPHETRRSHHRYSHELTTFDHVLLLDEIKRLNCMVMICTYDNNIYQHELANWRKLQYQSQTRGGTPATETIYMNYPEPAPAELHDPRFLGDDFRAREKSKRRIQTILRKLDRMEPEEKALLAFTMAQDFPQLASQVAARLSGSAAVPQEPAMPAGTAETCEPR